MSEEDKRHLRHLFRRIDTDNDQLIRIHAFHEILADFHIECALETLEHLLDDSDALMDETAYFKMLSALKVKQPEVYDQVLAVASTSTLKRLKSSTSQFFGLSIGAKRRDRNFSIFSLRKSSKKARHHAEGSGLKETTTPLQSGSDISDVNKIAKKKEPKTKKIKVKAKSKTKETVSDVSSTVPWVSPETRALTSQAPRRLSVFNSVSEAPLRDPRLVIDTRIVHPSSGPSSAGACFPPRSPSVFNQRPYSALYERDVDRRDRSPLRPASGLSACNTDLEKDALLSTNDVKKESMRSSSAMSLSSCFSSLLPDTASSPSENAAAAAQQPTQRAHFPYFIVLVTTADVAVMVAALIYNKGFTPMWINPMAGVSAATLIRFGAKYVPCMRFNRSIPVGTMVACYPEYTGPIPPDGMCDYYDMMNNICGIGGFPKNTPDQWFRFIFAIFLHVGLIHLGINAAIQLLAGIPMERKLGWLRVSLIYMFAGLAGNLVSGIFAPNTASAGASGAIYGMFGVLYLDLFQNWSVLKHPWRDFLILTVTMVLSFVMCFFIPFIDYWAHLGGFVFGFITAVIFCPTITFGTEKQRRRRKILLLSLATPLFVGLLLAGFLVFYLAF